jgi:uncharacterized protein YegP (UPF0339 family)
MFIIKDQLDSDGKPTGQYIVSIKAGNHGTLQSSVEGLKEARAVRKNIMAVYKSISAGPKFVDKTEGQKYTRYMERLVKSKGTVTKEADVKLFAKSLKQDKPALRSVPKKAAKKK